jgi:hypothetical protein
MTDAATAALDALRRWAATDRASLVAAAWYAGNTNITELARAAGRTRGVIYDDLKSCGIDHTDRPEPPTMPTTTGESQFTELAVTGWRHPHLLKIEKRKTYVGREYRSHVMPFTGREARPEIPAEWNAVHPSEEHLPENYRPWTQRREEMDVVEKAWAQARFTYRVGQLLKDPYGNGYSGTPAVQLWERYAAARDTLTEAYAALDTTPNDMWNAALLRIIDAKEPATKAARNWDDAAVEFAKLDQWLLRELGEQHHPSHAIVTAAKTHGVDITDWTISYLSEYESSWGHRETASGHIERVIETGDERIAALKQYTGES